jgi:hypothetical protein
MLRSARSRLAFQSRVELLDEVQVRACNADAKLSLAETPMLFLEFHGTEAGVAEQSSPVSSRAVPSSGQQSRRSGLAFGKLDIMFSGPTSRSGPVRMSS